ncbi:MAG: hypothetical protein LQ352_005634 [Teloschistes flavicans]|nr:MAG: hypothetical protein LQ352_005634 [Teloschistes flavicans]
MGTLSDHQCLDAEAKPEVPYLPPEIKQLIADYLTKSVLKNLRHVSRDWNLIATALLFDKVYISAYEMDFQIFTYIAQTPSLANSVKEVICDLSSGREVVMLYESYLRIVREEIKFIARPHQSLAFHSSNRRFNRFVNDFTQDGQDLGKLIPQYGREQVLVEGYRTWQQLQDQIRRITGDSSNQPFDDALRAGIRRFPRLEAVRFDNGIWDRHRRTTSIASAHGKPPNEMQPYDILGVVKSGSPLSRSWNPWYLRPKRSDCSLVDWIPWPLLKIAEALMIAKTRIKRLEFWQPAGCQYLTLALFQNHKITDVFPQQLLIAFAALEHLDLQITPHEIDFLGLDPTRALGFLPDFLASMVNLRSLSLRLESYKRLIQRQYGKENILGEKCLTYSQVFPSDVFFPRLENLHLGGLIIEGFELILLLHLRMPRSKRLSLGRIDLSDGVTWNNIVEVMRQVGNWEICCLDGPFRHKNFEWWPPTKSYEEEGDRSALGSYVHYISKGGQHPSLAPEDHSERVLSCLERLAHIIISERHRYTK